MQQRDRTHIFTRISLGCLLITDKEDTPMHNFEDPFHFSACRIVGCEIASVSCIAAGSPA